MTEVAYLQMLVSKNGVKYKRKQFSIKNFSVKNNKIERKKLKYPLIFLKQL